MSDQKSLETMRQVLVCASAWEPRARLLGNVTAYDIEAMCKFFLDPKRRDPGWISVEDRLPSAGLDVLVYDPSWPRPWVGYLHVTDDKAIRTDDDVEWLFSDGAHCTPTHWQPLPEPPEVGDE